MVQPVFIVGHARSGTTLMHRLMAADSARFSYFYYWEMFFPALTQKAIVRAIAWFDKALLSSVVEKRLRAWDDKTFGPHRHIHEQGLWIPEEDQFVMRGAFVSQQWAVEMPILHEVDIFHINDLTPKRKKKWMNHYKECLKRQLLFNGGNKTHLSKNPAFSGWIDVILDTFEDAKIIVMVRDPMQCIPSALRMMEGSWIAKGWNQAQYQKGLAAMTQISFDSYKLPARTLAQNHNTPHCFVDYRNLTSSPKEAVEQVYEALGLDVSEDYASYLASQEQREKKHKSKFKYDLKYYAVTPSEIETELEEFYQQYNWPRPSALNEDDCLDNGSGQTTQIEE